MRFESSIKNLPNPWKAAAAYHTIALTSAQVFFFSLKNSKSLQNLRPGMWKICKPYLANSGTVNTIATPCIMFLGKCFLETKGFTAFYPIAGFHAEGFDRPTLKHFVAFAIVLKVSANILDLISSKVKGVYSAPAE